MVSWQASCEGKISLKMNHAYIIIKYMVHNRCECHNSILMATSTECICCKEIIAVVNKHECMDPSAIQCIINPDGFDPMCFPAKKSWSDIYKNRPDARFDHMIWPESDMMLRPVSIGCLNWYDHVYDQTWSYMIRLKNQIITVMIL